MPKTLSTATATNDIGDHLFEMHSADVAHGERICIISVPLPLPHFTDDGVEHQYCSWWAVLPEGEAAPGWADIAFGCDDRWNGPMWHAFRWDDRR